MQRLVRCLNDVAKTTREETPEGFSGEAMLLEAAAAELESLQSKLRAAATHLITTMHQIEKSSTDTEWMPGAGCETYFERFQWHVDGIEGSDRLKKEFPQYY